MGFLENVEKTVFVIPIIALLGALGFGLLGALAGVVTAVSLGIDLISALKLGVLAGLLLGGSIGVFIVLAYLFKEVNSK